MRYLMALFVIIVVGCGDDSGTADMAQDLAVADQSTSTDQSAGDMAFKSACGKPGDTGNSKGVGKFCTDSGGSDCAGNGQATACSTIFNTGGPEDTFFCTLPAPCDPQKSATDQCGENTLCQCRNLGGSLLCGCTPDHCVVPAG